MKLRLQFLAFCFGDQKRSAKSGSGYHRTSQESHTTDVIYQYEYNILNSYSYLYPNACEKGSKTDAPIIAPIFPAADESPWHVARISVG